MDEQTPVEIELATLREHQRGLELITLSRGNGIQKPFEIQSDEIRSSPEFSEKIKTDEPTQRLSSIVNNRVIGLLLARENATISTALLNAIFDEVIEDLSIFELRLLTSLEENQWESTKEQVQNIFEDAIQSDSIDGERAKKQRAHFSDETTGFLYTKLMAEMSALALINSPLLPPSNFELIRTL